MHDQPAGLRWRWFAPPPTVVPGRPAVAIGVFDVLHVGHVRFLTAVRGRGHPLYVGVEDDLRVRAWKGPYRPVNPVELRAEVLAALRAVDAVFLISGDPASRTADHYLPLLADLRPAAIAFTSGDRHAAAKRSSAGALGAEAWELPLVDGISTTHLIRRLVDRSEPGS